jgi:hypothetical protein
VMNGRPDQPPTSPQPPSTAPRPRGLRRPARRRVPRRKEQRPPATEDRRIRPLSKGRTTAPGRPGSPVPCVCLR